MTKAIRIVVGAALLATLALAASAAPQKRDRESQLRSLVGVVFGQGETPLPDSVVYLKNTKTLAVKTFIADANGGYRFHALSPNTDYEVFAEYQGKRSDTKTLSAFDSRPEARINLKIDVEK